MPAEPDIKSARKARGWSQARLAREAQRFLSLEDQDKLAQQVVGRIEKGGNSQYRSAVLRALGLPLIGEELLQRDRPFEEEPNFEFATDAPEFRALAGRLRDVEELGVAVGGGEDDGDFELNGQILARQPRPPGLVGRDIFTVRVKNESMWPRFKEGELLYVERHREPAVGEDGIIELQASRDGQSGPAFIKTVVGKNSGLVTLRQFNPDKEIVYKRAEIKKMYRVVPWNEALGV